jgi:hypothetical protein
VRVSPGAAQQKPVEVRTMRVVEPVSFSASAIFGGSTHRQKTNAGRLV